MGTSSGHMEPIYQICANTGMYSSKDELLEKDVELSNTRVPHGEVTILEDNFWRLQIYVHSSHRCREYGHYAHSCPTKSSNSNHKAINITVTWDDSDDDHNEHDNPFQEGRNGLRAHIAVINSSCDRSDVFVLETEGEDHNDYESDNYEEPNFEELYSQLVSQLEKLKNEK
ncbi:hypothetical protein GIB67_007431 [Kingdonia uniflora]|uniref:Uncharacterized protein n=1 Tax=Kingdonia uniflora TaxID=39325 RepID=A0A7J7MLU3_9MAGN|nr:hypothetical protein GIB67_007431 [Kingdonia uniflora]